jgi:hypothetical protein
MDKDEEINPIRGKDILQVYKDVFKELPHVTRDDVKALEAFDKSTMTVEALRNYLLWAKDHAHNDHWGVCHEAKTNVSTLLQYWTEIRDRGAKWAKQQEENKRHKPVYHTVKPPSPGDEPVGIFKWSKILRDSISGDFTDMNHYRKTDEEFEINNRPRPKAKRGNI